MNSSATDQPLHNSAHPLFVFSSFLALGCRLIKHPTPRCAIKALTQWALLAACLVGSAHAQTTVIREYCERNLFCYKGLQAEDAIAWLEGSPKGWNYREMIPLPPTDETISRICAYTGKHA
ncbi:MAG TPA: hypothetical protein PLQ67_08030, partial [Burkholderiaceae bacterium]|nr:hypothetical protein [Burkholderiaceae bacterium]